MGALSDAAEADLCLLRQSEVLHHGTAALQAAYLQSATVAEDARERGDGWLFLQATRDMRQLRQDMAPMSRPASDDQDDLFDRLTGRLDERP